MWISTGTSARNSKSPVRPTGGAAELSRSWPSWWPPRRCRTTWRCPGAAPPSHRTWRRGAGRCSRRSPGCPWRGASCPPSLQLRLQHPDAHPNPSSKRRSPWGKPSSSSCRSSCPCSYNQHDSSKVQHFWRLAMLPGGDPPRCIPSHRATAMPGLCRCGQTAGRDQRDAPSPTEKAPVLPRVPGSGLSDCWGAITVLVPKLICA